MAHKLAASRRTEEHKVDYKPDPRYKPIHPAPGKGPRSIKGPTKYKSLRAAPGKTLSPTLNRLPEHQERGPVPLKLQAPPTQGKARRKPPIQKEVVRGHLEAGLTVVQIAVELDVAAPGIYAMIRRNPDLEINNHTDPLADLPVLGPTMPVLRRQDRGFLAWVRDNTPEGGKVSEFLVACAVDVWKAETEAPANCDDFPQAPRSATCLV